MRDEDYHYSDVLEKFSRIVYERNLNELEQTGSHNNLLFRQDSASKTIISGGRRTKNKLTNTLIRTQKSLGLVLDARLLDRFSTRRVQSIDPYKSYWLKCIEDCLQTKDLFDSGSNLDVGFYRTVKDAR